MDIYKEINNLNLLIEVLVQQKQPLFATKLEEVSYQCLGDESSHCCQLHHDCTPIAKHNNVFRLPSFCR